MIAMIHSPVAQWWCGRLLTEWLPVQVGLGERTVLELLLETIGDERSQLGAGVAAREPLRV